MGKYLGDHVPCCGWQFRLFSFFLGRACNAHGQKPLPFCPDANASSGHFRPRHAAEQRCDVWAFGLQSGPFCLQLAVRARLVPHKKVIPGLGCSSLNFAGSRAYECIQVAAEQALLASACIVRAKLRSQFDCGECTTPKGKAPSPQPPISCSCRRDPTLIDPRGRGRRASTHPLK